jgi:hypothetical protein
VALYVGTHAVVAPMYALPITLVLVGKDHVIDLDRDADGALILIADIKDKDGKMIVRLDKDEFRVNPNNYFSMKRKDDSTLIVFDQTGAEALNARYLNKRSFSLNAHFYSSGKLVDLSRGSPWPNVTIENMCLDLSIIRKGDKFAVFGEP